MRQKVPAVWWRILVDVVFVVNGLLLEDDGLPAVAAA